MQGDAAITIHGTRLTDIEWETIRASVDMFTYALAEGIEAKDKAMADAATEDSLRALTRIRGLLENPALRLR
jgi:hypothetical protein